MSEKSGEDEGEIDILGLNEKENGFTNKSRATHEKEEGISLSPEVFVPDRLLNTRQMCPMCGKWIACSAVVRIRRRASRNTW